MRGGPARPTAVVLGYTTNALGVYRCLGRHGIPVIAVHADVRDPILASRYCRPVDSPPAEDARAYERCLLDLAAHLGDGPVLIPTGDQTVRFVSERRESLARSFRFVLPPPGVVEAFLDKRSFYLLAKAHGLPVPATIWVEGGTEIGAIVSRVPLPAVVKPVYSPTWHTPAAQVALGNRSGHPIKRLLVRSAAELQEALARALPLGGEVIVQQYLEGADDQFHDASIYMGPAGTVAGAFTSRRLRTFPGEGAGLTSSKESVMVPELLDASTRFLRAINYRGCVGIQFKRHVRDGRFYAYEANPRTLMTNFHATCCGVPLPLMAYWDALGGPIPTPRPTRPGVKWIVLERELRAALEYRRRGELTLRRWVRSLRGPKVFGYWTWDDPRPAVVRLLRTCAWWRRLNSGGTRWLRRGLLALSDRLLQPSGPQALEGGGR